MRSFVLLLRIGSVRFTAFYFAAFYAALVATGHKEPEWIAVSLIFSVINCLSTELVNRYADRQEDKINRPVRTAMCEEFGFPKIRLIAFWLFALQVPIYIGWFVAWGKVDLFAVQIVCWLTAWNYSVGLRFKARKYGVLAVLTGTFVLPFLFGWTMFSNISELPPIIISLPIFVASIAGIKDITDVEGDLERGYESAFVRLMKLRSILPLIFGLSVPYLVIGALVLTDYTAEKFLWLLIFAPISLLFGVLARGAKSKEEQTAVREWMYHFWYVFLVATMALFDSDPDLLLGLALASLFWIIATRSLHWKVGLRRDQLSAAIAIIRRSLSTSPRADAKS